MEIVILKPLVVGKLSLFSGTIPALQGLGYPAKPSYSHCVELGRSDCHFSTAARVKKTVTPPTDKTVTVLALVS